MRKLRNALGVLLLMMIAAEIVFGSWFGPNYGAMDIQRNSDRRFDVSKLYPDFGIATFTTDEHGFRGRHGDLSALDLLIIGNDTTLDQFVTDSETWTEQLRRRFEKAGTPMNIAVAAYPGQTAVGYAARFDTWFRNIPELKARYVLVYTGSNERNDFAKYDSMVAPERRKRISRYIKNCSALIGWGRKIARLIAAPGVSVVDGDPADVDKRWEPLPTDALPDVEAIRRNEKAALERYAKRIDALVDRIVAFGAKPILVNQHFGDYRVVGGRLYGRKRENGALRPGAYGVARALGDTMMQACRRKNAICIDSVSEMGFAHPIAFYDHVHTAPHGNRELADYLYQRLAPIQTGGPAGTTGPA